MKKFPYCLALLLVLFGTISAQDITTNEAAKNVAVKFAPAGLGFGKVTVGAEYSFRYRNSITLVAGVPFDKTNTIRLDGEQSDFTSRAFSLMAGFRHYLGKRSMGGLYIEPYVKYLKMDAIGLLNKELQGENAIFDTDATYKGIGIGAQLGYQVVIAKIVVIDLYLLGPEANSSKASTFSTDITNVLPWSLADEQQVENDIRENLKDIPFIGDKIGVEVNKTKKTVATNYSGFVPGFRAGVSLGIRF